MKATELRIGNWVQFKYTETPVRITLGDFVREYKDEHLDDYEPIPLTEEWLVKFGFEKDDGIWEHKELMWSCEISGDDDSFNFKRLGLDIPCIGIFYVHQLQNLYFALTGQELQTDETDQKVN
jgi:hypothetical protein